MNTNTVGRTQVRDLNPAVPWRETSVNPRHPVVGQHELAPRRPTDRDRLAQSYGLATFRAGDDEQRHLAHVYSDVWDSHAVHRTHGPGRCGAWYHYCVASLTMDTGDRTGNYEIGRHLGSGAFATVWLAHDLMLDAPVAIKVLADNWSRDPEIRRRFIEEAKIMRRIDDEHVVRIFTVDETPDGRPYFAMEFADRGTLRERIQARTGPTPWPTAEAIPVSVDICGCLEVIHELGVVHRDLKPSNVLYRSLPGHVQLRSGRAERTLLGDFGLAKDMARASGFTLAAGTPAYMAPEQTRSTTQLDHRADLYSLGAILFELLMGHPPVSADNLATRREAPGGVDEPSLGELRDKLPPAVAAVLERSLAFDPADRFADAREMADELSSVLQANDHSQLEVAAVLDLGVRRAGRLARTHRADELLGDATPHEHLAPEVLEGNEPTPTAEVFGLASTLYALAMGEPPFPARHGESTLERALRLSTSSLIRDPRAGVPAALLDLLATALSGHPDRRPSAERLGTALQEIQSMLGLPVTSMDGESSANKVIVGGTDAGGTMEAKPTVIERAVVADGVETIRRPARRSSERRPGVLVGALAVAAVVVGGVGLWLMGRSGSDPGSEPNATVTSDTGPTQSTAEVNLEALVPLDATATDDGSQVLLSWTDQTGGSLPQLVYTHPADLGIGPQAVERGTSTWVVGDLEPGSPACFVVAVVVSLGDAETPATTADSEPACINGAVADDVTTTTTR